MVIASERSRIGQPEIAVGVFPPVAAAWFPKIIGLKKTYELLLTGKMVSAKEAEGIGLVNMVVPTENFREGVDKFLAELPNKSRPVSVWTKRAIKAGLSLDFAQALNASEIIYMQRLDGDKGREGRDRRLHREEKARVEGRVTRAAMLFTPEEEIGARLDKLKALMEGASLDGGFFHYKIDYYYFSGTMQDAVLFVPIDGAPILFVKRELTRARRESPLEKVIPMKAQDDIKSYVRGMTRVGMQLDVMPYNTVFRYKELLAGAELVDSSPLAKAIRRRKSPFDPPYGEGRINSEKVYGMIPGVLKEGMREIELGGIMEALAKPLGHEGILRMRSLNYEPYSWHILSGRTGTIVSQADSPMGGGLSPGLSRRGSKENAQGEADSHRFWDKLLRLPWTLPACMP